MMGVINITPDSFSDGGNYTCVSSIQNQINHFRDYDCKIFDFGAESTAPFNKAISSNQELERLSPLIELIKSGEFREDEILSFDTYKIETFRYLISSIRKHGLVNKIIFNDVSGVIDNELFDLMDQYDFDYIYSHSLVPKRELASDHMNYLNESIDLVEYFKAAEEEFSKRGVLERVHFDPCFGFSKTASQNLQLINESKRWADPSYNWVLGVSRKSFLKGLAKSESKDEQVFFSELIHSQILLNWMKNLHAKSILIRLHDPQVFFSAQVMK